jgi:hypothetical protein
MLRSSDQPHREKWDKTFELEDTKGKINYLKGLSNGIRFEVDCEWTIGEHGFGMSLE